ncbi:uncharacterized protein LOC114175912 isoform X2 [Vigna unguiculata]|uniref:uncharacterized protein LOC114175912 isoform X2 n=1 Tax=Vigna unguiculata TaxID=3917 RepID=UPI001016CEEE|nr:uncharacterized protein LOC114175912 isoform X2 [Vigna unguiculata]
MAFVAHQQQGLFVAFSSRQLLWSKRLKLKQCLSKCHLIGRADWHCILSVGPPHICGSKLKPLKISGFKGSAKGDDSVTSANGLKVPNPKTSVRLDKSSEVKSESPKSNNVPLSRASEANENLAVSSGIHKLLQKWLTMLQTPPPNQGEEEILGEPPPDVLPDSLQGTKKTIKGQSLKAAWSYFLALDAAIKIPFLIFAPFYLAVNVVYGAEVSKELAPLWVLGPLIMALYIMLWRWLCALYVFSFKQTIKVVKNSPSYCMLAYSYVFCGKLKEDIETHILQPILSITNTDYKQLGRKKLKELSEWIVEKYLDFVESIWPFYCRTIRFLKRANLI